LGSLAWTAVQKKCVAGCLDARSAGSGSQNGNDRSGACRAPRL